MVETCEYMRSVFAKCRGKDGLDTHADFIPPERAATSLVAPSHIPVVQGDVKHLNIVEHLIHVLLKP